MTDSRAKRAVRRRRTTRRLTRRPIRVPEDALASSDAAAGVEAPSVDHGVDPNESSGVGLRANASQPDEASAPEAEAPANGDPPSSEHVEPTDFDDDFSEAKTLPRIQLTEEMAMAAGRVTSLDGPPLDADGEAATNPQIRIASFDDASEGASHEASAALASDPPSAVVVTRPQIISDPPPDPKAFEAPDRQASEAEAEAEAEQEEDARKTDPRPPVSPLPPPASPIPPAPSTASAPEGSARPAMAPAPPDTVEDLVAERVGSDPELEAIALDLDEEGGEQALQLVDVDEQRAADEPRKTRTPPPPPEASKKKPPPPPPGRASQAAAEPQQSKPQPQRKPQWWEKFFSDDYLLTVFPPNDAQIARQVDFLQNHLELEPGQTVLDVGCGLGLHAIELTRRGFLVVGLDLSLPMITRAAEEAQYAGLKINFLHTDIREIEFDGTFDALLCLGTTFGFFDDESNRDVLRRLHQALKPGGKLMLDVVNRDHVIRGQPNLVWFQGYECVCMEESDFNYFNSRLNVKRTVMQEDGNQTENEYSIRLYSLHELGQLLQKVGFRVKDVTGQESTPGVFFGSHSTRMLISAERRPGKKK